MTNRSSTAVAMAATLAALGAGCAPSVEDGGGSGGEGPAGCKGAGGADGWVPTPEDIQFHVRSSILGKPAWSPDGKRIAYLAIDSDKGCMAVDIVASNGSDAGAPTRLLECGALDISGLAWVDF